MGPLSSLIRPTKLVVEINFMFSRKINEPCDATRVLFGDRPDTRVSSRPPPPWAQEEAGVENGCWKMIRSSLVSLPSLLCNWLGPSEDKIIKSVVAVFPGNHKRKKKPTWYWQQEKLYAKLTLLQAQAWHERNGVTHPKSSFRPPLGLLNAFVSALAVPRCRQGVATHSHILTRAQ